jgi:hypothetical protein
MAQRRNSTEKLQDSVTATETEYTYDQKNVGIRYQLPLKPYWLGWLKERLEFHRCELFPGENAGEVPELKPLAERLAAVKYLLKMIDGSSTVPGQTPFGIREGWKVLLLDNFHLEWLKNFLLGERKIELEDPSSERNKLIEIEIKCDVSMMDYLLETIGTVYLSDTSIEDLCLNFLSCCHASFRDMISKIIQSEFEQGHLVTPLDSFWRRYASCQQQRSDDV